MAELCRFRSEPEPCAYLHGRLASNEYRVMLELGPRQYGALLEQGWRRFGLAVFRPQCGSCSECRPLRLPVAEFTPSGSQRRVLRRNRDLELDIGLPDLDEERLHLYRTYHAERQLTRNWPATEVDAEEYERIFLQNAAPTLEFRYRLRGRLAAIGLVGRAEQALNAIYAYSDPTLARRSLGTFNILSQVRTARRLTLGHVYLGFLVQGCPSMAYKAHFRPHEVLTDGEWQRTESRAKTPTSC